MNERIDERIRVADVVPLHGPVPPGTPRARRRIPRNGRRPTRRSLLGGIAAAGFGMGMAVLGVFPAAREVPAAEFDEYYQIKPLPCPSYAAGHDCSPGCGPSRVCASCCRTEGKRRGYHHSSVSKENHKLRPNKCHGGWADGWLWKFKGKCGPCAEYRTYRCHDGWRRNGSDRPYYRTICRWTVECQ